MERPFVLTCALWVAACGGSAVVDGSSDGGGGSTSAGGSTTTSTNNTSGTTTTEPFADCFSTQQCCEIVCDYAASLPCFSDDSECGCGAIDGSPPCEAAWDALVSCIHSNLPATVQCFDGNLAVACGYCDAELSEVEQLCGGMDISCEG